MKNTGLAIISLCVSFLLGFMQNVSRFGVAELPETECNVESDKRSSRP